MATAPVRAAQPGVRGLTVICLELPGLVQVGRETHGDDAGGEHGQCYPRGQEAAGITARSRHTHGEAGAKNGD